MHGLDRLGRPKSRGVGDERLNSIVMPVRQGVAELRDGCMEELRAAAAVLEAAVETAVAAAKRVKGQQPSDKLVTSCYFAIFALLSAFMLACQCISDHARLV
jgi:hypothetical protein